MPGNKKPRKKYTPKPVISANRLITLPTDQNQVIEYAVKIGMLAERITAGTWTAKNFNTAVHVLNTGKRVLFRHWDIDKATAERLHQEYTPALTELKRILEKVRTRALKTGNYGVSGDERSPLVATLVQVAQIANDVSYVQFKCAEEEAMVLAARMSNIKPGFVADVWRLEDA